jgi:hypothetical protein
MNYVTQGRHGLVYSIRPMPFLRMAFSPSVIGFFAPPSGPLGLPRYLPTPRESATAGFFAPPSRDSRNGSEISLHLESWPLPASLLLPRDPRDSSGIFIYLESWPLPAFSLRLQDKGTQLFKYMKYFLLFSSIRIHSFVKHAIWKPLGQIEGLETTKYFDFLV